MGEIRVQIVLNGERRRVPAGCTILEAAAAAGIKIPTLCHAAWLDPAGTCGVCAVAVRGVGLVPACSTRVWDGMEADTDTPAVRGARKQVVENLLREHYADCVAPCASACPAGVDVQSYVKLMALGLPRAALDIIRETNPLPGVCGRICPAPCEDACRRRQVDEAVAIRALKRAAADAAGEPPLPPPVRADGGRVAVVGSGPAGLSAAFHLRRRGHRVRVFEARPAAGGMLRYGIPEYRLPRAVLDRDLDYIVRSGVEIVTGAALGEAFSLDDLRREYDAVFLATGATRSRALGLPGERLAGVYPALEFLHRVNTGRPPAVGARVAVIGGGSTALDCARTARRLGAEEVWVLYRRARTEMPAHPEEVRAAAAEGVSFRFGCAPVALLGNGRLRQLRLVEMRRGAPGADGRPRPEPVPGSEFDLAVDTVVTAIGQVADRSFGDGLEFVPGATVTSVPGVYAGGDLVTGPATAVAAIGAGRQAALDIDRHLRGGPPAGPVPFTWRKAAPEALNPEEFAAVPRARRAAGRLLPPERRLQGFQEVDLGLTAEVAAREAGRCLECGCKAAADCRLRELAGRLGLAPGSPAVKHFRPTRRRHPLLELDPNRCLSCGQCVRVCREVQGVGALALNHRVAPAGGADRLDEERCEACGQCLAVCPTGALAARTYVRPAQETRTICPYCGAGCGVILGTRGGAIVSVRGDDANPVNRGLLCLKGRFGHDFVHHPERLTTPLLRRGAELVPVSWDEALAAVAAGLSARARDGAVGVIGSAKCTNEEMYLLQKFARAVLGTNNIDHVARLCHGPSVAALQRVLGGGAMTNALDSLEQASCLVSIGANTTETHPVIGLRLKRAVRNGARLIVINPLQIDLCRHAELWLRLRPGTDAALLAAMAKVIVEEDLYDAAFIRERCTGFAAYAASLRALDLDRAAAVTGVPREKIVAAARLYARNAPAAILYAMGITQHVHGTNNVLALANLALLTGNLGKPGAGVNPLRGQNNVQGACDMGLLPNVFPGYQPVDRPEIRSRFEQAWGMPLPAAPGLPMTAMFPAALAGRIKALYIVGENPVQVLPDARRVREALGRLEFLVVQDLFLTETAALADVVLPAAASAEKDGTFVNTERRVQRLRRALPPPGTARSDLDIIADLARRLGAAGFDYAGPEAVMREITGLVPAWRGITYARLEAGGLCWPCPGPDHPGTPVLWTEQFATPDGKARFTAVDYTPPAEPPDADYPFLLTTGRMLQHFHTGTMSRRVAGLETLRNREIVRLNAADAARLGLRNGDRVRVASRRGAVTAEAGVDHRVPEGVVFMTFHFAEACANVLTNPAADPVAGIPGYKACAVRVERLDENS